MRCINEKKMDKEYLPVIGHTEFRVNVAKLAMGPKACQFKEGRYVCVQGLGNTGSLSLGAMFLKRY